MKLFGIGSFPRAIVHVDGDAFFVGCEVAKNPKLKGRPVVTGRERGIASALSYEAKRMGVTRGMRISDIKKLCPDVVVLPSDYETYSLYSRRMYEIVRRYTPEIEEYSIDECFADITGLRSLNNMSYEETARAIKHDLDSELGITFSVGLAPNKVLAKVASKWAKPSGLVFIPVKNIHEYISKLPVEKVWGIGPQTSAMLNKYGIITAYDFAVKGERWVNEYLAKPYFEIWQELRGNFVYELTLGVKNDYQSISKTKTFTPPSSDRDFIFSQLSKNIENACVKARRYNLVARNVSYFLKTQDFQYGTFEASLPIPAFCPEEIISIIRDNFDKVYKRGVLYRATGITLYKLVENKNFQQSLFGERDKADKFSKIYEAVDSLSEKYGKHAVFLGSSLRAMNVPTHKGDRGAVSSRASAIFKGETKRKKLGIPMLGDVG